MDRKDRWGVAGPNGALPPTGATLVELFLLFSRLGLSSFGGGVSAWMHRAFVEQRAWLGHSEFAAALALSRMMPGANVANLAVIIGQRVRGAAGAAAAVLGLLVPATLAVLAIAVAYRQWAGAPMLDAVLEGTAAAAVGLLIAMGLRSGRHLVGAAARSPFRTVRSMAAVAIVIAVFLLVGVLRFPMVVTVLCLAPLSIALAFFTAADSPTDQDDGGR